MNFSLKPRPLHPVLNSFIQRLIEALPYREPVEGEESQLSVIYHVYDHLTDSPGVQLELKLHQAIYVAKLKVSMSHVAGYGMFTASDDTVTLELERTPSHPSHARDFGPRHNVYRRKLRNANGNLGLDLDQFLGQVVDSVVFFFTHYYPGAMPEFSSWLHTSVFSLPVDAELQRPGRASYVPPTPAPLEAKETTETPSGYGYPAERPTAFPHGNFSSTLGVPESNDTLPNETP